MNISRITSPLAFALLFSVTALQHAASAADRPNILWIVTDDQRADSIAAFNRMRHNQDARRLGTVMSPNVDRQAKMGTTFINTLNNNPSCAPSRTIIHTGRYSHRTGVYGFEYYNPTGQTNWHPMTPEILRDAAGHQTLTASKLGICTIVYRRAGTDPSDWA
jgi:arylsulfatase A-like enzyme